MIFDNVKLLGYKHENKFFGEKSISYGCVKTFSIKGYILDLANSNGVNNILNTAVNFTKEAKDFQVVRINNESYGFGKIKSLSIDPGNWVRTTEYSADIEVLEEVPLQNMESEEFKYLDPYSLNGEKTPIDFSDNNFELLKNFNENFSLDFDFQNKIIGGEHSIDIEYDAKNKVVNFSIISAKKLATELLRKTIPIQLGEGNYTDRETYRVFNTETYDAINGKFSFKRRFTFNTVGTKNNDGEYKPYTLNRKQSIQLSEEGLVTVSENCEIKAQSSTPSLYANALQGLNDEDDGIDSITNPVFSRCQDLVNIYKKKYNILRDLNPNPINKSIKINKFDGIITYDISYDNDIKKENPNFLWEKTLTMERSEEGIWSASEEGTITGMGKIGDSKKFANAEQAWLTGWPGDNIYSIKDSIFDERINDFYYNYATNKNGTNLKELSKSVNRGKYNGTISYTYRYSDDPRIIENGITIPGPISHEDINIRKVEIQISDTGLPQLFKNFIIPNNTYVMIQNLGLTDQGTFTISAKLSIGCLTSKKRFMGLDCFWQAQNYVRNAIIDNKNTLYLLPYLKQNFPKDSYIQSISFSSDEIEKTVTYEEVYKYS